MPSNKGTMAIRGYDLYHSLLKAKAEVSVVLLNPKIPDGFNFEKEFVFNHKMNPFLRLVFRVFWLRKLKRAIQPEVTVSVLNGCSTVSVLSGGKDYKIGQFRAPFEEEENFFKRNFDRLAFVLLYSKLNKLYCVSSEIKNSILKNFPQYNKSNIEVVHNLFDFEKILKLGKEPIDIKEFESYKTIVHIGYFHPNKGQDRLIKAYSLLDDSLKQKVKLLFIGKTKIANAPQNYFANIIEFAKANNIFNNLVFLEFQHNPYKYLQNATLCVLSSYKEGLPGALIESLILNTPVITTNSTRGVWEAMNVNDDYNPNLNSVYYTPSGIITSNLADKNPCFEEQDIQVLSKALKYFFENEHSSFDFSCVNQFKSDNIIEKFTNSNT